MKGILVYAEVESERIHPVAFELLGKAREISEKIGGEVWGIILGHEIRDLAPELIQYGADKVFVYDHPTLREFDVIRYKEILVDFVKKFDPEIFLIGATPLGRSLAPRVAAALGTGLTADCIDLRIDENGDLIQIRPAFTGNILAHIKTKGKPVMATVRYRVMEMPEKDLSRDGEIIEMEIPEIGETGLKVLGKVEERGVNLAEADIIVAGGRGLKSKEDLKMLKELASLLGGVVGVSRPLVDEGWISKDHQIGFSGNTVKPKLYIACGISGSPQHLAGMRDSETIIAINTDPSAPIFRYADYGVVGDLYEVLPKLINGLKNAKRSENR
ncbi:MAG: electron transfer flavoprotein subunit alpha/FixB family protein [Thaumarchaeota archaeon]|nr:MAG: electron transfer flavoprotein subunit alpha/FixB family protein [Nitrososphaerota archaeon]